MVQAIGREPLPTSPQERQEYMLAQLEEGQRCLDTGSNEKEAASHFYRALMVAADKGSIAQVYDEQLPKVRLFRCFLDRTFVEITDMDQLQVYSQHS
jgi:hypothetical protein